MKTAVCQYSGNGKVSELNLTRPIHEKACLKHGYDYVVETQPLNHAFHPYWQKAFLIQRCIQKGYERIVWLDSDTLWNGSHPLDAPICLIGLVHHWHYEPDQDHWNSGVIYWNAAHLESPNLIHEWIHTPDDGHVWHDQWALNKLLKAKAEQFPLTLLPYKWNSMMEFPCYREIPPIVAAWHGCPNRLHYMTDYIANHR